MPVNLQGSVTIGADTLDVYAVVPHTIPWVDSVTGDEHRTILNFADQHDPLSTAEVPDDGILDILILGDGFTTADRAAFENYADSFYTRLMQIWPYSQFMAAFRVWAVFSPSQTRCYHWEPGDPGTQQNTYFGVSIEEVEIIVGGVVQGHRQIVDTSTHSKVGYRTALFDIIEAVRDNWQLNTRTYPGALKTNWRSDYPNLRSEAWSAFHPDTYSNSMRNLTVVQAVNRPAGPNISGYAHPVRAPSGHSFGDVSVRVGFGELNVHEFGHSFARLSDEYITAKKRGMYVSGFRLDPGVESVFTLSNVSFSYSGAAVPWRHLAHDGLFQRDNTVSTSRVGQQWIGGRGFEKGIWHSEYQCLMNGDTNAYRYRTDEPPTTADLRPSANEQLCLWCEELVTIRILEKTNAFFRDGDPSGDDAINELGRLWYWRWVRELRSVYWRAFDLPARINNREAWYGNPANLQVQSGGVVVWNGDLTGTDLMKEVSQEPRGRNFLSDLLRSM